MADLNDLIEGANFGLGVAYKQQSFHVKGAENLSWGMKDRLSRIFNPQTSRTFIMKPTSGVERVDLNILLLISYADCLTCSRGILQTPIPPTFNKPVCLSSDAGTAILTELNNNVLMDIEDAIRLNISAMALMLSIGNPENEALELCCCAVNEGAAGVDMGRNVFQSESPVAVIQAVHTVVHDGLKPDEAYQLFRELT